MKKQIFTISTLALLMAGSLSSCKKDKETMPEAARPKVSTLSNNISFTFYDFGTQIEEDDFLKNPDDANDEAYNYVEYALTLGLLEMYNNHPQLVDQLLQKTNSTRNKCYNLFNFADEVPQVDAIFNAVFDARFSDFSVYGNNWRAYVQEKYKYDVHYTPFVRFANNGTINFNMPAYVAAPFEISEEKFSDFDNNIPLWIKDGNVTKFTTLNEDMSKVIGNPVLLISNGFAGDESNVTQLIREEEQTMVPYKCTFPNHRHEYLTHHYFKINERYEGTGKSDYVFVWVARAAFRADLLNWENATVTGTHSKSVHKNDIGKLFHEEFTVFSPDMYNPHPRCFEIQLMASYPSVYKSYAVGAYEKDWYAGWKDVMKAANSAGVYESWQGRRKYSNEWYYFDPSTNNSYPFNVRNPAQHTTYYNYNKGELRLHRWNL
ncbi:hypothetical protein DBR32_10085 [Taibaiella sp. KBW10]|uniref:hypothetical protein n=1 Tax=Taibaiella sp. KBW10 TaxID=2153357 RepID=UPI000F5ADAB4|nr:hypothetical protein [Taibaiella sp. KBW10]RQO31046.1 hypothetical protein DBR32_10085 [Taibaiella sp. KBW10]